MGSSRSIREALLASNSPRPGDVARVVLDAVAVGPRNVTFEVVAAAPSAASGATPATAGAGALGSPAVQAALRGLNPDARV